MKKIKSALSSWCLVAWNNKLLHAKLEYAGRGRFRVREERPDQSILKGMMIDASNIISCNLAPG
jgi:hypothetical protein